MLLACKICEGQVLCIYCYDQNDSISLGVNNLLINGGFENHTCIPNTTSSTFCPNSNNYSCDIANWTCTGGGPSTYACIFGALYAPMVEGANAVYFGNYYCKACSPITNDTSCIINNACTVTGIPTGYPVNTLLYGGTSGVGLEQTVNGLIIGNTYVLEFWAGGEYNGAQLTKRGVFAVNVGFGDTLLREKPTQPPIGIGTRYIIEFNATSSSQTIKFTNWGHICDVCTELVIDNVRLYTLVELSASVPHCTLGIDDASASQNKMSISPNPFTNELTIKTNSNELLEIILYDIVSRKLLEKEFTSSVSINTEQLAKGIYIYEVKNKNGVIKKGKVVKE